MLCLTAYSLSIFSRLVSRPDTSLESRGEYANSQEAALKKLALSPVAPGIPG
jgi:hypothetical protein